MSNRFLSKVGLSKLAAGMAFLGALGMGSGVLSSVVSSGVTDSAQAASSTI